MDHSIEVMIVAEYNKAALKLNNVQIQQSDWMCIRDRDNEIVVSKQYPSAFFGTSLASTLTSMGVDSTIITGLTTSGCVRATCVDACSHGFIPIVVEQACGDRHDAPHTANLFDMNAKYADVVSEAEVTAHLNQLRGVST